MSIIEDRIMATPLPPAASPGRAITASLERHVERVQEVLAEISVADLEDVVDVILGAHRRSAQVYIVGNGGSASTASHFACDLSKSTIVGSGPRLRVTSLTDNVALLTAWANDTSYERVFAEQLTSLAQPGDVLLAISASGNSPNVLAAVAAARSRGAVTIAFVGCGGGALLPAVDRAVHVASDDYGVIEDCHLVMEHAVTASVRQALLG